MSDKAFMDDFNRWYYHSGRWERTTYLGRTVWKSVADLWVYQEIIYDTRPDLIIEMGTAFGGSALYMAHVMERIHPLNEEWRVLSVDINPENTRNAPSHPRVNYLAADSTSARAYSVAIGEADPLSRVMVVLDSDHRELHVLQELDLYAPLVTPGCYLIVEDTNVNGHPVFPEHGPGPAEALADWLPRHPEFEVDPSRTRFGLTFNPGGYLRKRS